MIAVVLCGGAGARLWPLSRELHPKPFLRLSSGQTLLRKSFSLIEAVPEAEDVLVVTNRDLRFKVAEEFDNPEQFRSIRYILEPIGRNTAPAIATAALHVRHTHGEDAILLVLSADHLIADREAFAAATGKAEELARDDRIAVLGVVPTSPMTRYSYLEMGDSGHVGFSGKPDTATAREYVETGRHLWNTGILCFKAGVMLSQLERHVPELLREAEACFTAALGNFRQSGQDMLLAEEYESVPNVSIDRAVLSKSSRLAAVPCAIGWNGVDSWDSLCAIEESDENGNRILGEGKVVATQTHNSDLMVQERLAAVIGLKNHLVVDTSDVLMVADKSRTDDVRLLYDLLRERRHESYKQHRTIYKPWGSFTLLEVNEGYKIKRLELKPKASISLQLHHHRSEHWIVVSGMAEVTCDDELFFVGTNESTYIKAGHKHRVANPGLLNLVLLEVQSGGYLGEDDIVRFEDVYGRVE